MSSIKKGLGRGLSSLIGETKVETKVNKLLLSEIIPNKYQPRKNFDDENLNDLTNSIKERGVIQPIIVRKSSNDNTKYEIIAGERRWQAAKKAELNEVPVVITDVDDLKSLEFAIVENVQRDDLNPLEEAQGYQRLIDEFSYDHEKVSKIIGKSRSYITNSLRLLSLPHDVLNLLESRKISAGHAKILVGLDNASFIAAKINEKNLSVRQAESFVKILIRASILAMNSRQVCRLMFFFLFAICMICPEEENHEGYSRWLRCKRKESTNNNTTQRERDCVPLDRGINTPTLLLSEG